MTRARAKLLSFWRSKAGDDFGDRQEQWEPVAELWGSIRAGGTPGNPSGSEKIDGEQTTNINTFLAQTEWHPDITADLECRFAGRRFGIVSVLTVDERAKVMSIRMREKDG